MAHLRIRSAELRFPPRSFAVAAAGAEGVDLELVVLGEAGEAARVVAEDVGVWGGVSDNAKLEGGGDGTGGCKGL